MRQRVFVAAAILFASVVPEPPAFAAELLPAPSTDVSGGDGSLSDKLSRTNGVIHPQDSVDPAMQKDAPQTGRMPVIPPAGSPGGAPNAQPK